MLQIIYVSVVDDHEMYLEVAEGYIDKTWKEDNIVDFWKFRDLLSNQMIKYNPTHHEYAGGTIMIPDIEQNQSARNNSKGNARIKIGRPVVEEVQV